MVNSLALFYYAKSFKLSFLTGNLLVAYASASTFVFGGIVTDNIDNSIVVAIFAFLFTLIREITKDIEDIQGDKELDAKTLPIIKGIKPAAKITFIIALLMLVFAFYSYLAQALKFRTIILLAVAVFIPLFSILKQMLKNGEKSNFHKIQTFMKIDMLILLLTLWTDIL